MGVSEQLLTGFNIGKGIRGAYDERKKQSGMKEAIAGVTSPRVQTQQEQQLEQQTLGFDDIDAQQWQPEAADWGNMRIKGAERIMETGGSLEDVERFQKYVDDKQKAGVQKYSALAADALDRGDIDSAARFLDVGYGYIDDGVLLQSANVDGQLMSFARDEGTGDMVEVPVPFRSGDDIRRMAQSYTDNDAFLAYSWGKDKFDKEFGLSERRVEATEAAGERADRQLELEEEAAPGKRRKTAAEIAKLESEMGTDEYGAASTGAASGISGMAGWKATQLNAAYDDFRTHMEQFNPNSMSFSGIPATKIDIYGDDRNPNPDGVQAVQRHGIGLIDVNKGLQAQSALPAAEKLARLTMANPDTYAAYMAKHGKADAESPTGFKVKIDNKWYNLPMHLVPDGGAAAKEYARRNPEKASAAMLYKKKDRPGVPVWNPDTESYDVPGNAPAGPAAAVPTYAPQSGVPQQQAPVPSGQAVQPGAGSPQAPRGAVQPPAPGLNATGYTPGDINKQVTDAVAMSIQQRINQESGQVEMDRETARELLDQLRGFRSTEADSLRDILKEIINGKKR